MAALGEAVGRLAGGERPHSDGRVGPTYNGVRGFCFLSSLFLSLVARAHVHEACGGGGLQSAGRVKKWHFASRAQSRRHRYDSLVLLRFELDLR